jgi:Delta3-Delta2-enoyl-CoA isomerase
MCVCVCVCVCVFVCLWITDRYEAPAVLITRAHGKIFSNGLDITWLSSNPNLATTFLCDFMQLMARVLVLRCRTIAAIQGHCFAGGMLFALAHDNRIMRKDRGFMCMNEVGHAPICY